ncbi:MAG: hypothetical protein R8K54_07040 [Mariprofundaceae bacterium]
MMSGTALQRQGLHLKLFESSPIKRDYLSRLFLDGDDMNSDYNPQLLAVELLNANTLLLDRLIKNNVVESQEEAKDGMTELLKFLFLCANNDSILTPSLRVDALWHEFILFSRSYTNFCIKYFSRYIHHQPSNSPRNEMHQYQHTLQLCLLHFGALNTKFWASAGICEQHCGSCESH